MKRSNKKRRENWTSLNEKLIESEKWKRKKIQTRKPLQLNKRMKVKKMIKKMKLEAVVEKREDEIINPKSHKVDFLMFEKDFNRFNMHFHS